MKFFVVSSDRGGVVGCELTLAVAKVVGTNDGVPFSVERVECPVNAETVRRLLGNLGGYATESETVYESSK